MRKRLFWFFCWIEAKAGDWANRTYDPRWLDELD